jgi:hypothetical protein
MALCATMKSTSAWMASDDSVFDWVDAEGSMGINGGGGGRWRKMAAMAHLRLALAAGQPEQARQQDGHVHLQLQGASGATTRHVQCRQHKHMPFVGLVGMETQRSPVVGVLEGHHQLHLGRCVPRQALLWHTSGVTLLAMLESSTSNLRGSAYLGVYINLLPRKRGTAHKHTHLKRRGRALQQGLVPSPEPAQQPQHALLERCAQGEEGSVHSAHLPKH